MHPPRRPCVVLVRSKSILFVFIQRAWTSTFPRSRPTPSASSATSSEPRGRGGCTGGYYPISAKSPRPYPSPTTYTKRPGATWGSRWSERGNKAAKTLLYKCAIIPAAPIVSGLILPRKKKVKDLFKELSKYSCRRIVLIPPVSASLPPSYPHRKLQGQRLQVALRCFAQICFRRKKRLS